MTNRLHSIRASLVILIAIFAFVEPSKAQSARDLIQTVASEMVTGEYALVSEQAQSRLERDAPSAVAALRGLGPIEELVGTSDEVAGSTWLAVGRAVHAVGVSDWQIVYSREAAKVVRIRLTVTLPEQELPPAPQFVFRGAGKAGVTVAPAALAPCVSHPKLCPPISSSASPERRMVEFLVATTRARDTSGARVSFSGERAQDVSLAAARVRIPEEHRIGKIELPGRFVLFGFELYEQKADPDHHFVIREVLPLGVDDWKRTIQASRSDEALVFVHGYNTSFDESLYRMAQIVWDLQYTKPAILFSWASRGSITNYIYDQQSALIASSQFANLIRRLKTEFGIRRVHVLAHSMGNLVVAEALKDQAEASMPLALAELIMAAPDLDRDYFRQHANALRKVTEGMTLYASSSDRAMIASRSIAGGIPRAGDVPSDGPLVVPNVDTIDVTVVGSDLLGLNHDVFASSRPIINDIGSILSSVPRKRPSERLVEILGMPEGRSPPLYWSYGR